MAFNSAKALPTPISVICAASSWCYVTWQKQKMEDLDKQRGKINTRLQNFYGPLHGNRMFHFACLKAVEKKVGKGENFDKKLFDFLDSTCKLSWLECHVEKNVSFGLRLYLSQFGSFFLGQFFGFLTFLGEIYRRLYLLRRLYSRRLWRQRHV